MNEQIKQYEAWLNQQIDKRETKIRGLSSCAPIVRRGYFNALCDEQSVLIVAREQFRRIFNQGE